MTFYDDAVRNSAVTAYDQRLVPCHDCSSPCCLEPATIGTVLGLQ